MIKNNDKLVKLEYRGATIKSSEGRFVRQIFQDISGSLYVLFAGAEHLFDMAAIGEYLFYKQVYKLQGYILNLSSKVSEMR